MVFKKKEEKIRKEEVREEEKVKVDEGGGQKLKSSIEVSGEINHPAVKLGG